RGPYFSRRKWIEPSPPRPAIAVSRARSWNIWRSVEWVNGGRGPSHGRRQRARGRARLSAAAHREHRLLPPPDELRGRRRRRSRLARVAARDRRPPRGRSARSRAPGGNLGLLDRDEAALAARPEGDLAVALREDRVVLADPGSGAGAEARAALADEDHPRRHVLAGKEFHAEHLRVRIAAVPRRAESLLVRHLLLLLECRFQRRERTLAGFAGALMLERRLDLLATPAACRLRKLPDRHRRVALRQPCGLLHLCLSRRLLRLLGLRLRGALRGPDRLDLDPRQLAAVAGVLLVAGAPAVLTDPDLLAELVPDDARGHRRGR